MKDRLIEQMIAESNAYADRAIKLVEDSQKKQKLYDTYGQDLVDSVMTNHPDLEIDALENHLRFFS